MKQTLDKLRFLLKNIGQEDIIQKPATMAEIFECEKKYHSPMPEEIKEFLMFSNGFEYGMQLLELRSVNMIFPSKYSGVVPDGWLKLGSLLYGSADLVSDENGVLFVHDKCRDDDSKLREFSLKSWMEEHIFYYAENDSINKPLYYIKKVLEKAGLTQKLNAPASAQNIAEWEKNHNALIPAEIKEVLKFSNGFRYGVAALEVSSLEEITFVKNWDIVPEGWIKLGSVIGDGAYLVSDGKGELFLADHENHYEPLSKLSLKVWIENHILDMVEEDCDIDRRDMLIELGLWQPLL